MAKEKAIGDTSIPSSQSLARLDAGRCVSVCKVNEEVSTPRVDLKYGVCGDIALGRADVFPRFDRAILQIRLRSLVPFPLHVLILRPSAVVVRYASGSSGSS